MSNAELKREKSVEDSDQAEKEVKSAQTTHQTSPKRDVEINRDDDQENTLIDLDESYDDDTPINPSQIINYSSPILPSVQIQQLSELDNYAHVEPNLPDILDMFESRESRDPRLRARSNLVVDNFQLDSSSRESQLVLVERTINIQSNVFQNPLRDQASPSKQKRACAEKREE